MTNNFLLKAPYSPRKVSIKDSNDVLNKFKSENFQASKLSTYDFSTLYTTLPHHLIKDKLIDLINRTLIRENTQYLACNEECAFFRPDIYNNHNLWSCQKVCDAFFIFWIIFLLDLEINFIGKLLVFRWELYSPYNRAHNEIFS